MLEQSEAQVFPVHDEPQVSLQVPLQVDAQAEPHDDVQFFPQEDVHDAPQLFEQDAPQAFVQFEEQAPSLQEEPHVFTQLEEQLPVQPCEQPARLLVSLIASWISSRKFFLILVPLLKSKAGKFFT